MAIDPKYIPLNYLQEFFVDKSTGLPLAGGSVAFYKDTSRTELKDIYTISGDGTSYSYVQLPNPCPLGINGGFVDNTGNDTMVYAYPYDSEGEIELYFLRVLDEDGALQFTRQGVPNISTETATTDTEFTNYIPNGQFLIHTDIVETPTNDEGEITNAITEIAQGGWTFERPSASSATDLVTFERYASYVENPSGSPRYSCRIRCTSPNLGDSYKGIRIKFDDVNKFSSVSKQFTFAFAAISETEGTELTINLIKNYGTGGSDETSEVLAVKALTTEMVIYNTQFIFGENEDKVIGEDDDDYLQLDIEVPPTSVVDVYLTDFILSEGALTISAFPETPNSEFSYQSITAPVPAHDGSDLYCSLRLTPSGLEWDHSDVGSVMTKSSSEVPVGYLLADGSTYETEQYSSDGIPYSRLQSVYWLSSLNLPLYGTGLNRFTAAYPDTGTLVPVINNSAGVVTATADGSIPTGFTFATIHKGDAGYDVKSYLVGNSTFVIEPNYSYELTQSSAGTTPFTVTSIQHGYTPSGQYKTAVVACATGSVASLSGEKTIDGILTSTSRVLLVNQSSSKTNGIYVTSSGSWTRASDADTEAELLACIVPVSSGETYGGKTFYNTDESITVGTTGIHFSLYSGTAIGAKEITQVQCSAASELSAGEYMLFYSYDPATNTVIKYYIWIKIDGVGTDPAVSGATGIELDLLSTDSASTNAAKFVWAINGFNVTTITVTAGSAITAGSYFLVHSTDTNFYVLMTVNGVGTDPEISGYIKILCPILSTDTANGVALKLQTAINSKYFAVPKYNGMFLRGVDNGAGIDVDAGSRYSMVTGIYGDQVGTSQLDALKAHTHWLANGDHPEDTRSIFGANSAIGSSYTVSTTTPWSAGVVPLVEITGNSEQAYPINMSVQFLIKY